MLIVCFLHGEMSDISTERKQKVIGTIDKELTVAVYTSLQTIIIAVNREYIPRIIVR